MGLLLAVFVHDAHPSDQARFQLLCLWVQGLFPRLRLIWVDSSYRGKKLAQWLLQNCGWVLDVETFQTPSKNDTDKIT